MGSRPKSSLAVTCSLEISLPRHAQGLWGRPRFLELELRMVGRSSSLKGKSDVHTSSTAQGGGGSFKNRKPIGEAGCCESGWQSEATDGPKGA